MIRKNPTWTEMFKLLEEKVRIEADLALLQTRTKGVNAVTYIATAPNQPPLQGRQPAKGEEKSKSKGKARTWSPVNHSQCPRLEGLPPRGILPGNRMSVTPASRKSCCKAQFLGVSV